MLLRFFAIEVSCFRKSCCVLSLGLYWSYKNTIKDMNKYIGSTINLSEMLPTEHWYQMSLPIEEDRRALSAIQNRYRELQELSKKKDLLIEKYRDILRELGLIKKCDFLDGKFQGEVNLVEKVDVACGPDENSHNGFNKACGPDSSGRVFEVSTENCVIDKTKNLNERFLAELGHQLALAIEKDL